MLRRIARGLLVLLALLALLALVLVVNTLRQGSRQLAVAPLPRLAVDSKAVAESLADAVRAQTVSGLPEAQAQYLAGLEQLQQQLAARYPRVHAQLEREVVGGHSLLFTWKGSDAGAKPIALMAHQDVVPIAPGTETRWQQPPFAGVIEGGFVWGRGSLDDKSNLVTELEAVERLLAEGFKPRRTIYLAFGHDEEVEGYAGAQAIVKLLQQRGVRLDFALDEGLAVTEGILPGVAQPLAMIGLAEKGLVSVRLVATAPSGHSSMPSPAPGASAIGMLSAALERLDRHPMPGGMRGAAAAMFQAIAPELPFGQRLAMSNLWLLRPVVESVLSRGAATNAMLRTTTAMTILRAGNKENVLPGRAEAVVNFRILPGDTSQQVVEHVRRVIADERIEVTMLNAPVEPSRLASADAPSFHTIERAVREVFPDAIVAPGLMLAGSDSRHFDAVADATYRFMPIRFKTEDLARVHGIDERIAVDQLADMVRFYHRLLQLAAGPAREGPSP
ncbi:MAG: M20 family peptidase [Burkholderiales bacterium]|nr:M20 family peptidase [Burkholderiales bacterium]